MKRHFAVFALPVLAGWTALATAQSVGPMSRIQSVAASGQPPPMTMPGMQHDMGGTQQTAPAQQRDNPAERIHNGPPVPDLLKDAKTRPPVQLSFFEQSGLTANPTLAQANAIVAQSAAQARQVGLYPNPSVGYQGEQIRGGAYGGGEQGAFLQQNIVLGGKLRLRKNIYEQQRQADQIGVSEQRYRILSDVGQSFYAALAAQELVNARSRLLDLALDALETAHQLANVGQADAPDVLQSEVEAEQAKVDYVKAQRTYMQKFQTLAALAGKPDLQLAPLAGNLENPPALDESQSVDRLVQDSPVVKRAQQDVLRAEAELKSARREPLPDLQLRAGMEQNFERLTENSSRIVGAQAFASAGITLPLFNRNQGNVAAARADLERAHGEVNRVQLSLRRSAQPFVQAYLSGKEEASRYRNEMIPRAQQAYSLYLTKYRQMGAAYPQVLVSQRTYFQLQISYIEVLQQLWSSSIALQNYLLTDGLTAPVPSAATNTTLNLPNANGAGAQ